MAVLKNRFETEDGEFRHEEGSDNGKIGEFSWTSPEGELVSFTYKADENGYQAQGSHLPQAPPLPFLCDGAVKGRASP